MSGQTKSFSEKKCMVEEFISLIKPYDKQENLHFDLRGYAKYIEEHSISGKDVPEEVVKMFQR